MTDLTKNVICSGAPQCGQTACPHFNDHLSLQVTEDDAWRDHVESSKAEYCSTCKTRCKVIDQDVTCDYSDGTEDLVTLEDLQIDDKNLLITGVASLEGLDANKLDCLESSMAAYAATNGMATIVIDKKKSVIHVEQSVIDEAAIINAAVKNKCKIP